MKSVAVIGAGPAGIIAARTLLRSFAVTVFEKQSSVGGLWAVSRDRPYDGALNPEMPTNVSRFSMGFTDLAWSSVGLGACPPYYPKAWQVGHYLQRYAERYLPPGTVRLGARVTQAQREGSRWRVRWEGETSGDDVFDYLVVGAGFFPAPAQPAWALAAAQAGVPVVHSSSLRRLSDVASPEARGAVVVVGGGMSGVDCAATVLAAQKSDARFRPGGSEQAYQGLEIVQVVAAPFYALPLVTPLDAAQPAAPTFATLDVGFYQLGKRPPGEVDLSVGQLPAELIKTYHDSFGGLVGDQQDLGQPGLVHQGVARAPFVALTDGYREYVRAGDVKIEPGRVKAAEASGRGTVGITLATPGGERTIENVVGIVNAVGYDHSTGLDFLEEDVRQVLEHDPHHPRLQVILEKWTSTRQEIPTLAFLGFHEGAFWLAMELQAKLIHKRFLQHASPTSSATEPDESEENKRREYLTKMRSLRKAMDQRLDDIPQYWMGDYVGYVESLAREVGIQRLDAGFPNRTGPVVIARYAGSEPGDAAEAEKNLAEFTQAMHATQSGHFTGRAAFRNLQGTWNISRQLDSKLDFFPSGRLTGTASFHPRQPTDLAYDFEYLYVEQGTLTTNTGMKLQASRRYAYRFQEAEDAMTVWFVKDDGVTVDYLFHNLKLDPHDRSQGWVANADHLCVEDMYTTQYRLPFQGAVLPTFGVVHSVKGPRKDYVSETWFSR